MRERKRTTLGERLKTHTESSAKKMMKMKKLSCENESSFKEVEKKIFHELLLLFLCFSNDDDDESFREPSKSQEENGNCTRRMR